MLTLLGSLLGNRLTHRGRTLWHCLGGRPTGFFFAVCLLCSYSELSSAHYITSNVMTICAVKVEKNPTVQ